MSIERAFYTHKKVGSPVKCPNPGHLDKNPSAILNETNIYCFACAQAFSFKSPENQYVQNSYQSNVELAHTYHNNLINAQNQSEIRQYLKKEKIK